MAQTGVIVVFLFACCSASVVRRNADQSTNFVGDGTNDLTLTMLEEQRNNHTNLVFSPIGYSVILAILAEGARGDTRNQLVSALKLPEDTYAVRNTYKSVLSRMQDHAFVNKPEFKTWFYVYKNNVVEKPYKTVLSENYYTDVKEIERDYYYEEQEEEKKESNKESQENKDSNKESSEENKKKCQESNEAEEKNDSSTEKESVESTEKTSDTKDTSVSDSKEKDSSESKDKDSSESKEKDSSESKDKDSAESSEKNQSSESSESESSESKEKEKTKKKQIKEMYMEDIISRALKNEVQVEKEMLTALSANRLSAVNTTGSEKKGESRMIIFNALYFRGNWSIPFVRKEEKSTFYVSENEKTQITGIYSEGEFDYGHIDELGATAIELHYQERYSLLLLLPDERSGLAEVTNKLKNFTFRQIYKQLKKKNVQVCLPRFGFYSITRPKDALHKMGVTDIFNAAADLSGITGTKGLYLDDLVQLVTVEVTEKQGDYNFLTTSNVEVRSDETETPEKFTADHPFIFVLRDCVDDLVVVSGKVYDPKSPSRGGALEMTN